ncbi:hypothetical protein NKR19_g329 [Coniochaeta hoffmannii]|uniref:Uncharacterized protein n=1 Tax=Coniochaeta hoffmannii TaxID=91930 RepID=A0AA38SMA8_9PEZI|nr:hypothetical protein NKR19_g329 [Coniochaeta hoffmannii]
MSGFKDIVKGGWHPDKDVPIKDSLKGLVGKGKKEEKTYREPIPITSLRDPASFPPPPKHVATGATPSPPPGHPYRSPGAGAAHQSYSSAHTTHNQDAEEAPPAPKPYRVDTTGLSTSHLPPPPRRTGGTASTPSPPPAYTHAKPPPPSLPPRLPPRTSTPTSPAHPPAPPVRDPQPEPKTQGYLNKSAINNLSSRGISVPGFGINPSTPALTTAQPRQPGTAPSTAGTTWAQERAALQTASSAYKDPTSVSASDAASAASTINNFHQRHGDQVGSVAGRINAFAAGGRTATPPHSAPNPAPGGAGVASAAAAGKKKPPPPPPPAKKPALAAAATHGARQEQAAPPPVPLGTRPQF